MLHYSLSAVMLNSFKDIGLNELIPITYSRVESTLKICDCELASSIWPIYQTIMGMQVVEIALIPFYLVSNHQMSD